MIMTAAGSSAAAFSSQRPEGIAPTAKPTNVRKDVTRTSAPLPAATCVAPPSGLANWWPGDGSANDIKGGNNGTPQNGVAFSTGKVGQAMSFNGVNQYVSLSNVDFRSDAAGSMGFWVQTTDAGAPTTYGNLKGAFFGRGNSVDQHLHLGIAGGKLTIEWYLSGHHSIQGTSNIADGNWHHVVFVSNGAGTVSLYVDGALENSGAFVHTSGATSTRFGSEYEGLGSYNYFYNGLIDEVEYFNRALLLSEVQAIYNAGSAGICRSCAPLPSGMVSWWPGDGNANDIRGGNNGIAEGGLAYGTGEVGQAFNFDGTTADVRVPASASLDVGSANGLTIDGWINPTTLNQRSPLVEWNNGNAYGSHFWMSVADVLPGGVAGNLYANLMDTSGVNHPVQSAGAVLTANTYQHVALTYDKTNGNVAFYVNGVAVPMSTTTLGVFTPQTTYALYLAFRPGGGGAERYSGQMDEVEVFNRALSQAEIQSIVNAGSAGRCRTCTPAPVGMSAWWTGDGNGLDSRGVNNGTWVGTPSYVNGMVGQALSFNGSSYVEVPDAPPLRPNLFTVDAWVYPTNISGNHNVVFKGDHEYALQLRNGNVLFGSRSATGAYAEFQGSLNVPVNTWSHVAITHDGATKRIYVNGVLDPVTQNQTGHYTTNTGTLKIGTHNTIFEFFNGHIDEVGIFDRDLSQNEIAAIYNAGSAGKCNSCTPAPVGLVSWWNGNGNALDARSRNDGTLENGAAYAGGKVGQAFDLGGTGQRVLVGNPASLQLQDFTIETWIKRSSATVLTNNPVPGSEGASFFAYGSGGYAIGMREATNTVFLTAVEVSYVESPTMPITDTNFHHVAVTKTGNQVVFYVDGNASPPITYDVNFAFTTNAAIGARGDANVQNSFFGVVDDLSIYSRALSAAEVRSIANANGSGKCKPTATTPPAGVVGWWGGDGFVSDISGNANHATLINGASFAVGKVGQAYNFDGLNDYVEVPDTTTLEPTTGMTIEGWYYFRNPSNNGVLVSKGAGSDYANSYQLWMQGGSLIGEIGQTSLGGSFSPTANTWYHIAFTWDGTNKTIYVNGTQAFGQWHGGTTLAYDGSPFVIGADLVGGGPTMPFDGMIDDLTFYNRAITQTEIQSIVNAGLAGKLKQMATLSNGNRGRRTSAPNVGFYALAGDATIYFPAVNLSGMTHEIPLDPVVLPPLPLRTVGLTYDIATSAQYTGPLTVCFNLPSFTTTEFATLHILHLENGGWVDVTYASSAYPSLCAVGLTSLSPFAIVTTAPTAAELSIAGRVVTAEGRGIRGAFVTVTGTSGNVRTVATGNLGRYVVDGLNAGETYIVTVRSRRFTFAQPTRVITLNDNVADADFIGSSGTNREQ